MRRLSLVVVAVVAAACTVAPPTADDTTTTSAPETTTTLPASTTTAAPATTTSTALAALEPVEVGPPAGTPLSPLGDELAVLAAPDPGARELGTLGFDETIEATGFTWLAEGADGSWYEVRFGGTNGFVPADRMAVLGATDDVTAAVVDYLGAIPTAANLEELAREVVDARGDGEWHVSLAPTEGDLGEITVDLTGFLDESLLGERLHVFAAPTDDGGWSLQSVERTLLCRRGVDTDGLCV